MFGGLRHLAVGEDGNLLRGGVNQFDGVNGALRIARGNIHDHNFGARVLNLAENGVGRPHGKAHLAEHGAAQPCRLQTLLQRG